MDPLFPTNPAGSIGLVLDGELQDVFGQVQNVQSGEVFARYCTNNGCPPTRQISVVGPLTGLQGTATTPIPSPLSLSALAPLGTLRLLRRRYTQLSSA